MPRLVFDLQNWMSRFCATDVSFAPDGLLGNINTTLCWVIRSCLVIGIVLINLVVLLLLNLYSLVKKTSFVAVFGHNMLRFWPQALVIVADDLF